MKLKTLLVGKLSATQGRPEFFLAGNPPEPENQVKSALLLDVVVRESSSVLKLFSGEDQSLLIWGDSLLILDLSLDVLDGVRWFDLEGDGLASQSLDEDLHASPESENQMESTLLLDVVVGESSSVLKLFSGEDQPLLIWGDSLLILDLSLDVLDGVRWFDLEGDGLASQGLDEDLHASPESENQMESTLLLDVVVGESSSVLQLFSG